MPNCQSCENKLDVDDDGDVFERDDVTGCSRCGEPLIWSCQKCVVTCCEAFHVECYDEVNELSIRKCKGGCGWRYCEDCGRNVLNGSSYCLDYQRKGWC